MMTTTTTTTIIAIRMILIMIVSQKECTRIRWTTNSRTLYQLRRHEPFPLGLGHVGTIRTIQCLLLLLFKRIVTTTITITMMMMICITIPNELWQGAGTQHRSSHQNALFNLCTEPYIIHIYTNFETDCIHTHVCVHLQYDDS